MGIITKEVEIRLWGQNIRHYHNLGYKGKRGDIILVKVNDLQDGCNVKIQYLCDYCKKEILTMSYADYIRRTKEVNKMACKQCYSQKCKETNLIRFGETSYAKTKEYQEKRMNTTMSRYGVEHYSKTQEYKEKWNNTCIERYGDSYRKQFMNKAFDTFYNKTGYSFPSQSPDVREKIVNAMNENGSVKCSLQQRYIFNLYNNNDNNVLLNYPIGKKFFADIGFVNEKIDIEYDGGFHGGAVKLGVITQEQFDKTEIIRNNVIKKEGYKQMRIISTKDLLPSDTILLQMLSQAKEYFSSTNHTWISYDIDNSRMINAENKDSNGVFFNFGELRKIKEISSEVA